MKPKAYLIVSVDGDIVTTDSADIAKAYSETGDHSVIHLESGNTLGTGTITEAEAIDEGEEEDEEEVSETQEGLDADETNARPE